MLHLSLVLLSSNLFLLQSCDLKVFNTHPKEVVLDSTVFPKDLQPAQAYALPPVLDEISGLTYLPTSPEILYAVQDEDGILYSYDLEQQKVSNRFKFAKTGDYEGLTTNGHHFYVLKSNGDIFAFSTSNDEPRKVLIHRNLLPSGEYESLAYDADSNKLYVLCKNCKRDKGQKVTTAYSLNIVENGAVELDQKFEMELSKFSTLNHKLKSFRPSALAKHPNKEEWYILSSIDKMLVITDPQFVPKRIIPFSRKAFEQPEGLVFDDKGNLFISSEVGNKKYAMIYRFEKM